MKRKVGAIFLVVALTLALGIAPAAPVSADPDPGLVGLWHFDEGSGTTAYDSSGNTNDGTLNNFDWTSISGWVDGKFGKALSFDGVNDYVEVAHHASLQPSEITIEAWIYPLSWNHTPTAVAIAAKRTAYGNGYFLFYYRTTSTITFDWGGSSGANRWNTGYNPPLNTWTHLAVTRSSTGRALYVNGVLYSSTSHAGAPANVPTTSALRVGCDPFLNAYPFRGLIDEVRIWDEALPGAAIQQSYELGGPQSEDPDVVVLLSHQVLPSGEVVIFTSAFHFGRQDPNTHKTVDVYLMSSSGDREIYNIGFRGATPAGTNGNLVSDALVSGTHWQATVTNGEPGIRGRTSTSIHLYAELDEEGGERLGVNAQYLPYD